MNILDLTYASIAEMYIKKGFVFFDRPFSINLFGFRACNSKDNDYFNDKIGIAYKSNNSENFFLFPATVDPGIPWLLTPINTFGAAAIKEGRYPAVWKFGYFKGTEALIQLGNFVLYRDNNRNETFEYNPNFVTNSPFTDGIFLHEHFQNQDEAIRVGRSSAGCVVPQRRSDKIKLFSELKKQITAGLGDRFTFTLFKESDLFLL